jgi:arsenate reductase
VIFMVLGKDVRHLGSMTEAAERRAPRGVLFLCRQNAARSQMAEALARKLLPPGVNVASAGSEPAAAVNPWAVRVMEEAGIDISTQQPTPVAEVAWGDFDTVITLCAEDVCVVPPRGLRQLHWPLPDPAVVEGTEDDVHAAFRRTRDEVERRVRELVETFR